MIEQSAAYWVRNSTEAEELNVHCGRKLCDFEPLVISGALPTGNLCEAPVRYVLYGVGGHG